MVDELGVVIFGDVVRSRCIRGGAAGWLESLCAELDDHYGSERLAGFEFTQGDELQGLLHPLADPFEAVLRGMARPSREAPAMRWAVVFGRIEPGLGPATRRSGPAFMAARETIELARRRRDNLLVHSGDPDSDALLDGIAPVLGSLLRRLTDRQRQMAGLALLAGLRQSDVAERLGVSRATVSVAFARADVRSLARLLGTAREVWRTGVAKRVGVES